MLLSFRFVPQMGWAEGICNGIFHSISAFCNAGFDLMGKSEEYSSLVSYSGDFLVNITIMLLIIIGGIGFLVWDDLQKKKFRFKEYRLHTKIVLVVTFFLIFGGANKHQNNRHQLAACAHAAYVNGIKTSRSGSYGSKQ